MYIIGLFARMKLQYFLDYPYLVYPAFDYPSIGSDNNLWYNNEVLFSYNFAQDLLIVIVTKLKIANVGIGLVGLKVWQWLHRKNARIRAICHCNLTKLLCTTTDSELF